MELTRTLQELKSNFVAEVQRRVPFNDNLKIKGKVLISVDGKDELTVDMQQTWVNFCSSSRQAHSVKTHPVGKGSKDHAYNELSPSVHRELIKGYLPALTHPRGNRRDLSSLPGELSPIVNREMDKENTANMPSPKVSQRDPNTGPTDIPDERSGHFYKQLSLRVNRKQAKENLTQQASQEVYRDELADNAPVDIGNESINSPCKQMSPEVIEGPSKENADIASSVGFGDESEMDLPENVAKVEEIIIKPGDHFYLKLASQPSVSNDHVYTWGVPYSQHARKRKRKRPSKKKKMSTKVDGTDASGSLKKGKSTKKKSEAKKQASQPKTERELSQQKPLHSEASGSTVLAPVTDVFSVFDDVPEYDVDFLSDTWDSNGISSLSLSCLPVIPESDFDVSAFADVNTEEEPKPKKKKKSECKEREVPEENQEFLCETCGKILTTAGKLKKHSLVHSENRPFSCDVCNGGFLSRQSMKKHKDSIHLGIVRGRPKNLLCPVCGKAFAGKYRLRMHGYTHTDERPFACKSCGRGFNSDSNLSRHMRVHTGDKPHECQFCHKRFIQKSTLQEHEISAHTKEYLVCGKCGKKFGAKWKLNSHLYHIHGDADVLTPLSRINTNPQRQLPPRHKCRFCSKPLASAVALKDHERIHTGRDGNWSKFSPSKSGPLVPRSNPINLLEEGYMWS